MKKIASTVRSIRHTLILVSVLSGSALVLQNCGVHYVASVPSAPVEVRPAPPYTGAIWIDGGWNWRGGRHVWTPGYYSRPRVGHVYYPGEWKQGPRGHYYVRGRWR